MEKIAITCPKCGTIFDLSEAVQEEFIRALTKEAQEREREDISLEMHDLRQQLKENKKLIKEAREKELELLRQKRLFDEKLENLELEIERKIDQEREGIAKEVKLKLEDDYKFRLEEKDHKLKQVIAELEAAQRKAEQSSQQLTGEIAEVNLEEMLAKAFPTDGFEPVKKGVSGADILHLVQTLDGESCGTIIWESKNTIHWNNQWLSKLKVDQLAAKAELAVLVSNRLPDHVPHFTYEDGIWITGFPYALGLAMALRESLVNVAQARRSLEGTDEKIKLLYQYLSGSQFKQRVEMIVTTFDEMKQDLEREKRAMNRLWSKRDKEIGKVIHNISGMYGDMQGIIGAALPTIQLIELPEPKDNLLVDQ